VAVPLDKWSLLLPVDSLFGSSTVDYMFWLEELQPEILPFVVDV